MPNFNIVIGLGGTGEKCVSALIHDICVGNVTCKPDDVFKVMLIDKDSNCATLNACRSLIAEYEHFRQAYTEKLLADGNKPTVSPRFAIPKIEIADWNIDAMINPPGATTVRSDITVKQAIGNNDNQNQQLLDMVYSDEEQDKGLQNGFYGHPTLGATIFRYAMKNYKGRGNQYLPVVQEAVARMNQGNIDVRVFIFGSIFGGNGASILPNVAREIKDELIAAGFTNFKIGGVLVLPFFCIPTVDKQGNPVPDSAFKISENTFMRKTIESLRYYESAGIVKSNTKPNGCFDRLYILGNKPFDVTSDYYADGGADQDPHFHLVNMLAANAACDFFNAPVNNLNATAQANNVYINRIAPNTTVNVDEFTWDNLDGGNAIGVNTKSDRYMKMACLAEFYTGYMYPQFNLRHGDAELMRASNDVAVICGRLRGTLFHVGDNDCTPGGLNELKGLVNAMNEYLQEYIIYLDEVANTGINWCDMANRGASYCRLFNRDHLDILKTAVDSARRGTDNRSRDNEIQTMPKNLTLLGNIDDIADVVDKFFTKVTPGRDGLYKRNYARLVDAIYGSFVINARRTTICQ